MLDAEQQQAAVLDLLEPEEGLRPVTLAEDLPVLAHLGADPVVAGPRPVLARPVDVVEALALPVEGDGSVERFREPLGPVFQRLEVEEAHHDLVEPAVPDAVEQELPVGRDVHDVDARPVVEPERLGVEEEFVLPVGIGPLAGGFPLRLRAPVDARLEFAGTPQGEELGVPGFPRPGDLGDLHEFAQPGRDPAFERGVRDDLTGVLVLGVDPRPGLGTVLVLEPAVGIGDLDPVDGVRDHLDPGLRRRRPVGRAPRGQQDGDRQDCRKTQGNGNGRAHGDPPLP